MVLRALIGGFMSGSDVVGFGLSTSVRKSYEKKMYDAPSIEDEFDEDEADEKKMSLGEALFGGDYKPFLSIGELGAAIALSDEEDTKILTVFSAFGAIMMQIPYPFAPQIACSVINLGLNTAYYTARTAYNLFKKTKPSEIENLIDDSKPGYNIS